MKNKKLIRLPVQYVTKGKLNRMLKYFKGKSCKIIFEYSNSLCQDYTRKYSEGYDRFEITEAICGGMAEYSFILFKNGRAVFEQDIPHDAMFTGLGHLTWINDGPSCFFSIKNKRGATVHE